MEALEDEADLAAVADLLLAREACHFPLPHAHAACVGTIHGADHVEQSGFARAGWACDRHQSARGDNEIDAVESRHARAARAVALREAGDLAALTELRQEHRSEPLVQVLIQAAILHTEANLRIVELAEKTAGKLVGLTSTGAASDDASSAAAR